MDLDEAVVLRTYSNEAIAILAETRLGFEGIETRIQKDDCGGAYPLLQMCRGVRLLVNPEDVEDAEEILNKMEAEESGEFEPDTEQEHPRTTTSPGKPFEFSVMKDPPSQQLDELKTVIFMYVVIAPLLSALFADKIDNFFVTCLLFVGLVGTAFTHLRNRLRKLEETLKEQERRLRELEDRKHVD
jgi:hypothetical protein